MPSHPGKKQGPKASVRLMKSATRTAVKIKRLKAELAAEKKKKKK